MTRRWLLALAALALAAALPRAQERLRWRELPSLPDTPGLGGPFVGVHRGDLVVAGGANFPDAPPWQGGRKAWHDRVYVLDRDADAWRLAGRLPAARAYGGCASTSYGIALLGGNDAERTYADCSLLTIDEATGEVAFEAL
ncbi:MAG: sodium:solute symporter, partial [Planctomycetes bacterium]|nr:sodium:solute symporter [Planctomycetota bacterium]